MNQYQELIAKAQEAYQNSYAPYSHFPVGAAVKWDSGRVTTGVNVENASYGLGTCAERNAIFQGISEGERKVEAVVVAVPGEEMATPCGACRQVIREFTEDCPIILVNGKGETKKTSLKELLPDSFGPENLHQGREKS